jgi:ribosomal protein S12 methylthiotransferase
MTVLVDEAAGGRAVARSYADAPEIDGVVHIAQGKGLKAGDFVKVRITRSDDYDLWGKTV